MLINGAAGGVGTFAVQVANSFGAEVTGVCSTRNVELVRSVGGDHVIDYTGEDFTLNGQRYDLILDCVSNHSLAAYLRILNPKGAYVIVGGSNEHWGSFLRNLIKAPLLSRCVSQSIAVIMAKANQKDLVVTRELLASGKVKPVIDRIYSLSEAPEAILYLEEGHASGKIVIAVD